MNEITEEDISDALIMHPNLLDENEARRFILSAQAGRLAWRMEDAYPLIAENDDGTRQVRAAEKHRVIVSAFDQWCAALGARWDASDYHVVLSAPVRADFGCEEGDLLVALDLKDWVVNSLYVLNMERFLVAASGLGMTSREARSLWFDKAGDPPKPTITRGYGVHWGSREVIDPRFNMRAVDYARKRAERAAMQKRAPHAVSLRRTVEVDAGVAEYVSDVAGLTPEQLVDRFVANAKKLGRRDINETIF